VKRRGFRVGECVGHADTLKRFLGVPVIVDGA